MSPAFQAGRAGFHRGDVGASGRNFAAADEIERPMGFDLQRGVQFVDRLDLESRLELHRLKEVFAQTGVRDLSQ